MPHDIIDNRDVTLVAKMRDLLPSTEMARFAVGYFFLSGLEAVADVLDSVQEMRLLIGNTTNRRTLEQIAEGYRRLSEVQHHAEALRYPKSADLPQMAEDTAASIGETAALMDQSDEAEYLVASLADMIAQGRLHVRVYTRGRLHAKAYICTYGQSFDEQGKPLPKTTAGVGIVGSSNLSLAGITSNTELNVMVHGDANHAALVDWFDRLWDESEPFEQHLIDVLQDAWPLAQVTPYEIYLKTLWELVRDRIEAEDTAGPLWRSEITEDLAEFQQDAVHQAIAMIDTYGGCFVSDVVGLGKTYVGAAILKHYVMAERAQPLIICPAPLVPMWESFSARYDLNSQVLSMGMLREREGEGGAQWLRDDPVYRHCSMVLVDESHNFRNNDNQRYRVLQTYLAANDRRAVFLTATPRNTSAWDLYHQIKLFHQHDITILPIDPPDLRAFVRLVEEGRRRLPDLLTSLLIRRCRRDILRQYGYDAETEAKVDPDQWDAYRNGQRKAYILVGGKKQFFPERHLETVRYSIEETYDGLYEDIRKRISPPLTLGLYPEDCLTYARYGLGNFVLPSHQKEQRYQDLRRAGRSLSGLMRIMLFKRFESSVQAFRLTVGRMLETHRVFLEALHRGIIPAGEDAQKLLGASDQMDERELYDTLLEVCGRYEAAHFDLTRLTGDLSHDIAILEELLSLVEPITPDEDDKLQTLRAHLQREALRDGKRLIFTQFADTAQYLYDNLGDLDPTLQVIYSSDRDPTVVAAQFSPKANPDIPAARYGKEINLLVATDVLSEGLNLQDCDRIINYDLHWNPVRLIQRFGRI
ncbi:MAG: helicase-related protein, partial [Anaerolineae bacterium]